MLRTVLGALIGYLVIAVITLLGVAGLWVVLGAEAAFREGTTVASNLWAGANCVIGLVAAIMGGLVAAAIGRHPTRLPVKVLAGLVLLLGMILAFRQLDVQPDPLPEGKTVAELTFVEAGTVAVSPTWYNFAIPLIGTLGVLMGGYLVAPARR